MNKCTITCMAAIAALASAAAISNSGNCELWSDPSEHWRIDELFAAPAFRELDDPVSAWPGLKSLMVSGKGPNDTSAEFFCYYGRPEGPVPEGGFPGVVLAHGGGGTAYPNYTKEWIDRGFAVIALDWYNQRPAPGLTNAPPGEVTVPRIPLEGGKRQDHVAVVANMVLSHSLLRSFPEVNRERTVFVGLSWGSWYGTCVAAVDDRFRGCVEIYCGGRDRAAGGFFAGPVDGRYLPAAKIPMWWAVSTNDRNVTPQVLQLGFQECANFAGAAIVNRLPHSHVGFQFPSVQRMAMSFAGLAKPLPRLTRGKIENGVASAEISDFGEGIVEAKLGYTTSSELPTWKREWKYAPAKVEGSRVTAVLPPGTVQCYLSAYEGGNSWRNDMCGSSGFLDVPGAASKAYCGAPSFSARSYFAEARRAYRTAEYASGTNSIIHRHSREDPFGFDGRYDMPDPDRRRIPDEPIFWCLNGLRNVRDIGGWTGLRPGMVYRGSQLYLVEGAPDGIDPETSRVIRRDWRLATDFDLRGVKEWGVRDYEKRKLAELTTIGVRKISHKFPSYEKLFEHPEIVGAALKDLAKPETYPTYIHCAGGADRTGSLIFILEALCGVPEADIDIDYELTSFATIYGIRDRNVTLSVSFKRFKDMFKAYPGKTLAEQVENACITAFGLTKEEVESIRRILVPETEWMYSLVDQTTGVEGEPGATLRLRKGWNLVKRGIVPVGLGGGEKGKPIEKIVRQPTPPPFPSEQRRAYEFSRSGRRVDDNTPLFSLEKADGWTAEAENAVAKFSTTYERCLFGDTCSRLEYRADFARSTNSVVRLRPPKPVPVAGGFDAMSMWIYGNFYSYDRAPGASNFDIAAEFENASGERRELPLGTDWCMYWFQHRTQLQDDEKAFVAGDGVKFTGLVFKGFTNEASVLSLDLSNFAVFRDSRKTPQIPRRPKRGARLFADQDQGMNTGEGTLPFPNTPNTVIPPVAGEDPDLEFRFPAKPDESWDDLAFRYQGGEWIRVAIGGGVLPRGAGKGGRFEFRRVGDSIVCDMMVKGGAATDVAFGDLEYDKLPGARKVPVPFYHSTVSFKLYPTIQKIYDLKLRPGMLVTELGGEPFFISATWDWTQSAGSWPYCESEKAPFGGVAYFDRTDGTRADVCERFVWSFSRRPIDTLANIPNPKSPYKHLAGKRVFAFARSYDLNLTPDINPQENETRERIWDYWRRVRRLGIRDLNVNGHEKMWRDYMDSFTFKTNAAPLKGGDAPALEHAVRLKSLDYRVGPYNNFTDFAPVNENWNPEFVARMCTAQVPRSNQFYRAWTRTYLPKPVYAVHAMETLLPEVKRKFDFQNAYSDVHTAYSPWFRVDYDSRMPGAASMTSSFYPYAELMWKQKFIWNGPVYSEGWGHVAYAGLSDGDFARDDDYFSGVYSSKAGEPWNQPWIVDYDLLRIHPLNCCIGTMARNFWGKHKPADRDFYADKHLCYVLAFGHALLFHNGYFMRDNSLMIDDIMELREYYMPLPLASRYTQADAVEIRYGDGKGGLLDSAHAIASGAVALNQVKVLYSNGTAIAVNGGEKDFTFDWFGEKVTLPPNCYVGKSGNDVKVFSSFVDGHRADLSVSPDYVYVDGRGKFVRFDEGASDGLMIRLSYTSVPGKPLASGEEDVLLLRGATVAELPYEAESVSAMDAEGCVFAKVAATVKGGRTEFRPVDGAISYRVKRRSPRTWCNPLSLPELPLGYLCRDNRNGDKFPGGTSWRRRFWESNTAGLTTIKQFREVADPAVLVEGNKWYLYPSCGLMWESEDCGGTWKRHHVLDKGWYAPAVAKCRGKYYLVETGGQPLKVSDSPTGPFRELGKFKWETFGADPKMPPPQDPALMADGDRLYLYWGCCSYPKAVWGAELDPDDPTRCKGEAKCLVYWDPKKFPFHDELIEGAWAFRRGGTVYLVYSTYSIVGHMYCMNAAKSDSPLGEFTHQKTNPFLQTPQGLVTGTGHGSVWKDASDDYWVNYCVEVNAYNGCERLIGQDRLSFDDNGDIVCRVASQTPQWLPSSGKSGDTGWQPVTLDTAAAKAVDGSLQTWWEPPAALPATVDFEFRSPATIESCRVIWRDLGLDTMRGVVPGPVKYRIDRRSNGKWATWIDRSDSEIDLMVDYREGEECEADAVRLVILGAPKGITPALVEFTVFAKPNDPPPAPGIAEWGFRREIAEGVDSSGVKAIPPNAVPWLTNRISRCFFGPIKRPPFNRDELSDDIDYYPDAYLAQLRDEGVNGLWLTIEFRDLVETSFNRRHPDAQRRLAKFRKTVEKCAKYGIGVWAFAIEPRCANSSREFYEANKDLFSRAYWPPLEEWDDLMCPSLPKTRQYLREAMRDLFTQVPGLKGFLNISHGERWTSCLSTWPSSKSSVQTPQPCPRCSKRQPWEVLNDLLGSMRDGMHEASPDAEFISWFYMAEMDSTRNEWVYDCARHFPKGVTFQFNFESGIVREQEGRPRVGGDYWLAQPGPSDIFRRLADISRESGTRLSAKIQVSASHEMATVPYVPVPGLLYRKFKAMRECGVSDAMYCWYFGCNPGLMNRAAGLLSCDDFSGSEDDFLSRLAASDWGEDAKRMAKLWKTFSDAYSNYPLSNMMQYYGPFHDGVAWELHPDLDLIDLSRSWQRDRASGDVIGEALEEFTLEDACALAGRMCSILDGTDDLDALAAKYATDVRRSRDLGVMKAFRILCRSGRDVLEFYRERRNAVLASRVRRDSREAVRSLGRMRAIAEEEMRLSAEMDALCARDSRLGFHPEAETYKFHPALLKWRIADLGRVVSRIDAISKAVGGGAPYPESAFERTAPVFTASRDADGRVVVEGDTAPDRGEEDVTVYLHDLCGTEYPTKVVAKASGGRFKATLPDGDRWAWIRIERPGTFDLPAPNRPHGIRLKLMRDSISAAARLVVSDDRR